MGKKEEKGSRGHGRGELLEAAACCQVCQGALELPKLQLLGKVGNQNGGSGTE